MIVRLRHRARVAAELPVLSLEPRQHANEQPGAESAIASDRLGSG